MAASTMHADMGEIEKDTLRLKITDAKGILKQNREFLDFFWDIAKPHREIRLKAIESLIEYLKKSEKSDELKYTLKRLVDGLSHSREDARSGHSIALAQVLSVFEDISLQTTLDQIKEKHNLQTVTKKLLRNVAFGNFFGVLALSQSTRLPKEPQVLLECIQILQSLSQYREHLRDLPRKTMVDILSETSEEVFEEVLLGTLQSDLTSAFSTPEQMELLLVAMQKFPAVLKPEKLIKLLGTSTIITTENIPKLIEVLKMAGRSVKKDRLLPTVALDLLQVSLREESFELFWRETIVNGMLKDQPGPSHYLSYRLLGASLPLLSIPQLRHILSGDVMRHYGEHVLCAQLSDRFKFAPEMEAYVKEFLQGCTDSDKQLAMMVGFTQLTNQGYPVVPSLWTVVEHLQPAALHSYVDWLKDMFSRPQLEACLDFTTRRQKQKQESAPQSGDFVFRLRKWIIPRLTSIVENQQIKKDEDLVMDIGRFIFFHAYFDAKKSTPDIPETKRILSVPLDQNTRPIIVNAFFGLLQHLNHLPVQGDSTEGAALKKRRVMGVTADGTMWIYCMVQYADMLLNQTKYAQITQPFTPEQRKAWDSMLGSVESLRKKAKKSPTPEVTALQQLLLLVGIHIFKTPDESVELMQDLQSCIKKAQAKKTKKKKAAATDGAEEEEPQWVEVVVEILLSLLAQPSRLIRQVCKTVFTSICPHVTQRALTAILNVLDPNKDEDDGGVVVTDEKEVGKKKKTEKEEKEDEDENEEASDSSDDDDDDEEDDDDEAMEEEAKVDQNFRLELMKVLQGQNALATEEDGSEDEELDDEAMMKLDGSIAALFTEHKKKIQAKKDEKERLRMEKILVRDFKIKVLDLVEVFLTKRSNSPLVLGMIEPLLRVIESGMSSESDQQEQDFLRKAADIFRSQLCRGKQYCRDVTGRVAELHDMLERLLSRAQKLSDSSVSLFFFSAALYVVKVLRGVVHDQGVSGETKEEDATNTKPTEVRAMGSVDVERVTACFKEALCSFMTRRKSPLTGPMFIDVVNRFPVLCVNLLDTAVENITGGVREHQQSQACAIVLSGLQSREVQQLLTGAKMAELLQKTVDQVTKSLEHVESKNKALHEKIVKALELCQFLVKTVQHKKLVVNLEPLQNVLKSMNEAQALQKAGQLEDTYWSVMKYFGVQKPKNEKKKAVRQSAEETAPKKKKGFLPETKKRKRKKHVVLEGKDAVEQAVTMETSGGEGGQGKKKKKIKNKKRKHQGGEDAQTPSAPKKAKTQQMGKKKKGKQGGAE